MEPSAKSKKKWIIFGAVIAVLALLIAVGPVLITRYMRSKASHQINAELMIKVKGTIKKAQDSTIYLAGDNNLYYILIGDYAEELAKNIDKKATIFGNIIVNNKDLKIEGNPVRMKIEVTNYGLPDIDENKGKAEEPKAVADNSKAKK